MGKKANEAVLRGEAQRSLFEKCDFPKGAKLGIWPEVKVQYNGGGSSFDYAFDYVLMPLGKVRKSEASTSSGSERKEFEKLLRSSGHGSNEAFVEDFPIGKPVIAEVMASSTSGGNKRKHSCIPQAFEDCILAKEHTAPGINYRQVWARMASQLVVKSQAAMAWGGKAIWVLQDLIASYISSSTALDLRKFASDYADEVNILAFSYGDNHKGLNSGKTIPLPSPVLCSGPIRANDGEAKSRVFRTSSLRPCAHQEAP